MDTTEQLDPTEQPAPMEQFFNELERLDGLLNESALDPDPGRVDWMSQRDMLEQVWRLIEVEIMGRTKEVLSQLEDEDERVAALGTTLRLTMDAAALLFVAGRRAEAERTLSWVRLEAEGSPTAASIKAAQQAHGDFLRITRAWWLLRHDQRQASINLAKRLSERAPASLAEEAQSIINSPQPMSGAPFLGTLNGCGLSIYGNRDPLPDGSYTSTRFLTGVYIPLLPIDAFRVAPADEGALYFLGKVPLGKVTRAWRALMLILIIGSLGGHTLKSYLDSPGRQLAKELKALATEEQGAESSEDRIRVANRYEQLIHQFAAVENGDLERAAEAVVRLSCANIKAPLGLAQVDQAKRVIRRYRELPSSAVGGSAAVLMAKKLESWLDQLGTKSAAHLEGGIQLLLAVQGLALESSNQLVQRRVQLQRDLATALAGKWPLEAIQRYIAMSQDKTAQLAAGKLLQKVPDSPSIWIELGPALKKWDRQRRAQGLNQFDDLAAKTLKKIDEAYAYTTRPEYKKLLAGAEPKPLAAALKQRPADQEIAAALAERLRARGKIPQALSTLEKLGAPGHLCRRAQGALASIYSDLERFAEAQAILERQLASRLPAFEEARRAYQGGITAERERLIARAREGRLPSHISEKLKGLSDDEQGKIFGEWLSRQLEQNSRLKELHERYMGLSDVVPLALNLGMVKLRQAQRSQGPQRDALLSGAEQVFLSIQTEAEGVPSFHLGLGQVYHRLGKSAQGEKEFTALLDQNNPDLSLAVGRAYRELGLIARAKSVCTEIFEQGVSPHKEAAAVTMALMAGNRDERADWFSKADQKYPFVQTNLLNLAAAQLLDEGKLAAADRKYARVAQLFGKDAARSSAAANNAALAWGRRYDCTGDLSHLDHSIKLLESALRLESDSALVMANLCSALEFRITLEVLGRWLKLPALRLTSGDSGTLLASLIKGTLRSQVQQALGQDPRLQRMLQLSAQEELLAPGRIGAYERQARWFRWLEDLTRLKQLEIRLSRVKAFDTAEEKNSFAQWVKGERDPMIKQELEQRRLALKELRGSVVKTRHNPSLAAVHFLEADTVLQTSMLDGRAETLEQATLLFLKAHQLWPTSQAPGHLLNTRLRTVIQETAGRSPEMARLWTADGRRYDLTSFLYRLLNKGNEAALTALRASPKLGSVVAKCRNTLRDRPDLLDWVLGRISANAALTAKASPARKDPLIHLRAAVEAKLMPYNPSNQATLELLKTGGQV